MKEPRRLSLKRDALADLTQEDLRSVVGALPISALQCLTEILDPPDNTHVCSDTCYRNNY